MMQDSVVQATRLLLAERTEGGWWEGELSTSALSTATAVHALLLAEQQCNGLDQQQRYRQLADGGLSWLVNHQNKDGGWGDTVKSISNISTTMLVHAVLTKDAASEVSRSADVVPDRQDVIRKANDFVAKAGGVDAVIRRYGKDHTFSVPILTHCALAGTVEWDRVMPLPFELACVPSRFYAAVKMPVVSYALPALIAIGQVIFEKRPPRNPIVRWIRKRSIQRSLKVLDSIQPGNGGFLEATPLTSFVCMSLLGCKRFSHPVTQRCLQFIEASVRQDGSWPIDTNLATWVTTLSVNALYEQPSATEMDGRNPLSVEDRSRIRKWLLDQQYKTVHPFTNAAPGGWSWIDQPGGVPDADDTPGAMLAIMNLRVDDDEVLPDEEFTALRNAANWLLDLQNRDGGWPTFCKGWGTLPFDRSSNDISAHAIRALHRWQMVYRFKHRVKTEVLKDIQPPSVAVYLQRIQQAIEQGFRFLDRYQRKDGSWLPLWFGNQHNTDDENPLYGTAKVLMAYAECGKSATPNARKAVEWVVEQQNDDSGWSAVKGLESSVEETGLAIETLSVVGSQLPQNDGLRKNVENAAKKGVEWLTGRLGKGTLAEPSPIGFYFAKLWYFERLYPLIFAVSGLRNFEATFGDCQKKASHQSASQIARP